MEETFPSTKMDPGLTKVLEAGVYVANDSDVETKYFHETGSEGYVGCGYEVMFDRNFYITGGDGGCH